MASQSTNALDIIRTGCREQQPSLNLHVVFTDTEGTRGALQAAREFGRGLHVCVNLVVAQVVPYPLPLEEPDISRTFTKRSLLQLLENEESEVQVRICLCRDRESAIRAALPRNSTVLIGGRRRWWWPGSGQQIARLLRRDGHKVIFVAAELLKHEHTDNVA